MLFESYEQLTSILQAAIGRVNARAGEERRVVPQRDEKTLIHVAGVFVEVTLRPLSACFAADSSKPINPPLNVPNVTPGPTSPQYFEVVKGRTLSKPLRESVSHEKAADQAPGKKSGLCFG